MLDSGLLGRQLSSQQDRVKEAEVSNDKIIIKVAFLEVLNVVVFDGCSPVTAYNFKVIIKLYKDLNKSMSYSRRFYIG